MILHLFIWTARSLDISNERKPRSCFSVSLMYFSLHFLHVSWLLMPIRPAYVAIRFWPDFRTTTAWQSSQGKEQKICFLFVGASRHNLGKPASSDGIPSYPDPSVRSFRSLIVFLLSDLDNFCTGSLTSINYFIFRYGLEPSPYM